MEPGDFIKVLDQNGQIAGMVGEVARGKALSIVLSKAKVVDTKGKAVDISAFTAGALGEEGEGGFDTSAATSLLEAANDHDHDHGDHEGHSH
jgi:trigger factor